MIRLPARSLRMRLTIWYSGALLLVALILAGASRWALMVSLHHALDQSLRYRLIGLHEFIGQNSNEGLGTLTRKLQGLGTLGELFQVFGPQGELLAQSDGLARHHFGSRLPPDPQAGMRFRDTGPRRFPVRMATQRIFVNAQPLILEVADPLRKFDSVLTEFYSALMLALPVALLVAALGGYWLSGRALAPVDQIIDEARSIDPANLAARLSVPPSGDELQRLSQTLNGMLDRVEQSVLRVRRFTADASHELRAPMTLIYTAAEFALRRERSSAELKDSLRKVLREAKRCTELINQLLTLARSDAGPQRLETIPTDLGRLLEDVVNEVRVLAIAKGLRVTTDTPAQNTLYRDIDPPSFRRMLVILLDNAVKYTPEGGAISIGAHGRDSEVAISISDTGIGIPPEQLPYVFDRFWRADPVRSRDAGGTGLGLSIAREIARAHGAELSVESAVGHGSTFTIRFGRSSSTVEDRKTVASV